MQVVCRVIGYMLFSAPCQPVLRNEVIHKKPRIMWGFLYFAGIFLTYRVTSGFSQFGEVATRKLQRHACLVRERR